MVQTWITTPKNDGTSEQWYSDDGNAYNWNIIDLHRDTHRQTTGYDVTWDDGSKDKVCSTTTTAKIGVGWTFISTARESGHIPR